MTNWIPPTVSASDAWWTVVAALALYGGRKVLDALLPKGWVFRAAHRYLRRHSDPKDSDPHDVE